MLRNKKILTLSIVIVAVVIGTGAFYYVRHKQKNSQSATNQAQTNNQTCSTTLPENKDQCLARLKDAGIDQLSSEVLRTKTPTIQAGAFAENSAPYGQLLALKGLFCSYLADQRPENLQLLQDFIKQANFGNTEKEVLQQWFQDLAAGKYHSSIFEFAPNLALGDLQKICPQELPKMCQQALDARTNGQGDAADTTAFCQNICGTVNNFKQKQASIEAETLKTPDFVSGTAVAAVEYRFFGADQALNFCNQLSDKKKATCAVVIRGLDVQKFDCGSIPDKSREFVCNNLPPQ